MTDYPAYIFNFYKMKFNISWTYFSQRMEEERDSEICIFKKNGRENDLRCSGPFYVVTEYLRLHNIERKEVYLAFNSDDCNVQTVGDLHLWGIPDRVMMWQRSRKGRRERQRDVTGNGGSLRVGQDHSFITSCFSGYESTL
jgi:hypothetical protein